MDEDLIDQSNNMYMQQKLMIGQKHCRLPRLPSGYATVQNNIPGKAGRQY